MSKTHGTNVHVIDGVEYVEVDRKAKLGDKVVAIRYKGDACKPGDVLVCIASDYEDGSIDAKNLSEEHEDAFFDTKYDEYRVLVPAEQWPPLTEDEAEAPSPTIEDLIANLARRVSSLETQLVDSQRNIERQAEELAALKHLAESNEEDIRTLDERTQPKYADAVTFDNFLDSIAEKVAERLVGR
jgi:hypothetical protein